MILVQYLINIDPILQLLSRKTVAFRSITKSFKSCALSFVKRDDDENNKHVPLR